MSTNPVVNDDFGWRISRLCDSGACVGVARHGEFVLIGNSSDPEAPVSRFTAREWHAFIAGVKLGDFDDIALYISEVSSKLRAGAGWLARSLVSAASPGLRALGHGITLRPLYLGLQILTLIEIVCYSGCETKGQVG